MAEILTDYKFGRGRESLYPWKDWLDGRVWKITRGEDFLPRPDVFRVSIWKMARQHGLRTHTKVDGESIILQAYTPLIEEDHERAA